MADGYSIVGWSKFKRVYDVTIALGVVGYIGVFMVVSLTLHPRSPGLSPEIAMIRALGTCAFLMLTLLLCIGPLARLSPRFKPLLYNRRHLGVITFFVVAWHASKVLGWYHDNSDVGQLESLFSHDVGFFAQSLPFQLFGALALVWLAVMAATSHDFWNKNLGPQGWKALHMGVYAVYGLAVLHVAFGALQYDIHVGNGLLLGGSVAIVGGLHMLASLRSTRDDAPSAVSEGWLDAGPRDGFVEGRPQRVVPPTGERIAVMLHEGEIYALHAVCRHQGGPLDEGRIIDGCLTCPWHGWQYRPDDGKSPPPFTEEVPTHETRIENGRVYVNPTPREA